MIGNGYNAKKATITRNSKTSHTQESIIMGRDQKYFI